MKQGVAMPPMFDLACVWSLINDTKAKDMLRKQNTISFYNKTDFNEMADNMND